MRTEECDIPLIKGSKKEIKNKNFCYLTMQERQSYFRILVKRGIKPSDAKERIKALDEQQRKLNNKLTSKSEKSIQKKHKKMLDELWNLE